MVARWLPLAALILVLDGGCGSEEAAPSRASAGGGADPIVACGPRTDGFPADALRGPTGAESADTPEAEALRDLIANPGGIEPIPEEGWRLLTRDDQEAVFGAESRSGLVVVTLRSEEGHWTYDSSGDCARIMVVPPDGSVSAVWWPDPAAGEQRNTTVLRVLATDLSCASGRPTGDRLHPPSVTADADNVIIAFTAEPLGGNQTCPGGPPTPYEVQLREPVGDRTLLDGAHWPPRPPEPAP